jgi:hypothetical protein
MSLIFVSAGAGPLSGSGRLSTALRSFLDRPACAAWPAPGSSPRPRQEVFAAFGPEADMQLFGRGLRRRLPSMLGGDQARMRMVYSLMFSLRGAPVLFYGEEIGMAENLEIEGRMSVRSPMQWSGEANAGFSTAAKEKLRRPVVSGDDYGPSAVNVADQRRDSDSMLNWMERLIRTRKECPEIGWGTSQLLDAGAPSLFAQRFDWGDRTTILLHNLAGKREHARLCFDRCEDWAHLHDLLGDRDPQLLQDKRLSSISRPMAIAGFASTAKASSSCRSHHSLAAQTDFSGTVASPRSGQILQSTSIKTCVVRKSLKSRRRGFDHSSSLSAKTLRATLSVLDNRA